MDKKKISRKKRKRLEEEERQRMVEEIPALSKSTFFMKDVVCQLGEGVGNILSKKETRIQELKKEIMKIKQENKKLENFIKNPKQVISSELEEIKSIYERESQLVENQFHENDKVISLNVGSHHYQVLESTLKNQIPFSLKEKNIFTDHYFSDILSKVKTGKIRKDKNGEIFICRNGANFQYILQYIRERGNVKKMVGLKTLDEDILNELYHEAEFYQLNHFAKVLKKGALDFSGKGILKRKEMKEIMKCFKKVGAKVRGLKLIFNTEKQGFSSTSFQQYCHNKGPTLIVIESTTGCIFGGYNPQSWNGNSSSYKQVSGTFMFSAKNPTERKFYYFPCKNQRYAIIDAPTYLSFGGGFDVAIYLNSSNNSSNYSNLGHSYECYGKPNTFLNGQRNYLIKRIEVFSVNKKN